MIKERVQHGIQCILYSSLISTSLPKRYRKVCVCFQYGYRTPFVRCKFDFYQTCMILNNADYRKVVK